MEHPCEDMNCMAVHGTRRAGDRVYFRRADATEASKTSQRVHNTDLSVFGYDKDNPTRAAAKQYYCMTLAEYAEFLARTPQDDWCFYEVIAPDKPCRIYLDAEADLLLNPAFDGAAAHALITSTFTAWLAEHICPRFADPDVVTWIVLDSSSPEKWSRHYIAVGECMENMFHVGAIIRRFEQYCADKYGTQSGWFIDKKHKLDDATHKAFIIDNGVYTEFRLYRCIYQRKRKSKRVLLPVGEGAPTEAPQQVDIRDIYDTLVQPPHLRNTVLPEHASHRCLEADGSEPISCRNAGGQSAKSASSSHHMPRRNAASASAREAKCSLPQYMFAQRALHVQLKKKTSPHVTARYYPEEMTIMVPTPETYCAIKQDHHHGADGTPQSHAYYCINLAANTITQRCFSSTCSALMEQPAVRARATVTFIPELVQEKDKMLAAMAASGARLPGHITTGEIKEMLAGAHTSAPNRK